MLTLAILLLGAQELPPVAPGTCRLAADRFAEFAPRVRQNIIDTTPDEDKRAGHLSALDADLEKNKAVLAAYRDVKPTEADGARLNGLRGSQLVDYVKACADALRASTLPPVSPGLCKAVAVLDLRLLDAVRKGLEADGEAARKRKPHKYDDDMRGRMLAIIDGDVARDRAIFTRYAAGALGAAEVKQGADMPREDQRVYLEACAA